MGEGDRMSGGDAPLMPPVEGVGEALPPVPPVEPAAPPAAVVPEALPVSGEAIAEDEPPAYRAPVRLIALVVSLAACWLASDLLIPVMLAMLLALLANPLVTRLRKLWVPRWLGSLVVVVGGLVMSVWLSSLLIAPAADWVKQAPTELRQLAPKLKTLTRSVDQANKAAASIVRAAGAAPAAASAAAEGKPTPPNLWSLISAAPRMLAGLLAVVLLAYFFLVYGQDLQRQAIDRLPRARHKEITVEILKRIETDLSHYVLTISLINLCLGAVLAAALYWMGLAIGDALLWGTLAALLNYVPYVGPLSGVALLALVGVVAFDQPARMAIPPALYLGLHVTESQFVTPIVLGRRMAISPLVMLLWLMLWGFLWGVAGLLLAVPMLASIKIVAERVPGWEPWAKLIE
jgi:predicted PurR-regulated permease PerM